MVNGKWYYGEVHEVEHEGGNPPGFGGGRPARPGNRPDNSLPGRGQGGNPSHPWVPPSGGGHPDQGLPGSGGSPDQELPELPPEVGIWPPPSASHPIVPVPPDHALPPGSIYPPLPDHARGKFLVLAWISGEHEKSGWHYIVVDADAKPDHSLPGGGHHPSGQPLPPGGAPPRPGQPGTPTQPIAGQPGAPAHPTAPVSPGAPGHQPAPAPAPKK